MCISYDIKHGQLTVDQSQYLCKVLMRFGMDESNAVTTPLPEKLVLLAATNMEAEEARNFPYLKAIGSLMYTMTGTCPNIAYEALDKV
jgi:hypothetical protein